MTPAQYQQKLSAFLRQLSPAEPEEVKLRKIDEFRRQAGIRAHLPRK